MKIAIVLVSIVRCRQQQGVVLLALPLEKQRHRDVARVPLRLETRQMETQHHVSRR